MLQKITDVYTKVKDFAVKWWFVASTIGLGVLVFLLDSKGKKVRQLTDEIQLLKMNEKLSKIKEKAGQSEQAFQDSMRKYNDLKRLHPELYDRATQAPDVPPAA